LKRDAAEAVEVESKARKWVAFAKPAAVASLWQSASGPAEPEVVSKEPLDTNAWRPGAAVTVSGLMWEVSKQYRCKSMLQGSPSLIVLLSLHTPDPPISPIVPVSIESENVQLPQVRIGLGEGPPATVPALVVPVQT